jgi:hypothetical protein
MASRGRARFWLLVAFLVVSTVVGVNLVLYRTNDGVRIWWEDARRSAEEGRRSLERRFR